jgi:hypothetical protein
MQFFKLYNFTGHNIVPFQGKKIKTANKDMKLMAVFLLILLSALVFILSFMPTITGSAYSEVWSICGQVGLGLGLLLFLILSFKKKKSSQGN